MNKIITDKDLGDILLRTNPRSKGYTLKVKEGRVTAVMPEGRDMQKLLDFITDKKEELLKALDKLPKRPILNESTKLLTQTFSVRITRTDRDNFYMALKDGILNISCPQDVVFENERVQDVLKDLIGRALRHEATRLLPKRLDELAEKHSFAYSMVKISKSTSRWGSCSSRKSINLSCSLMLLPQHLSDYVLLHELCHTKEMSHSERFWALMDSVTDGKAKALREELKKYKTFA
jgi:Predicted metal-dependent hydrolase